LLGKADSAAASLVARLEDAEHALADATARIEALPKLDEEVRRRDEIIVEMQRTRVWRMGQRYWRARDALKRVIPRNRP
jgi:hypothetical protein